MTKELNIYLMANANGDLVRTQTKRHNGVKDLYEIIERNFNDVIFLTKTIFEHTVNGKKIKSLLRRVVSSGDKNNLKKKRVQVIKKDVDRMVDDIISIYQFNGALLFIRSTNPVTLNDLPTNITTLFWIDILELAFVLKQKETKKIIKISRRQETELILGFSQKDLYSNKNIDYIQNNENSNIDIFSLPIEPESDYVKVMDNNENNIKADKEVGRFGEELIYNMLFSQNEWLINKINKTNIKNLVWQNQYKESYMPYDIIADNLHIEVKSSKNNGTFIMSANEKELLDDETVEYILIKIDGIDVAENTYHSIMVYSREELKKMNFKEMKTFSVKEK